MSEFLRLQLLQLTAAGRLDAARRLVGCGRLDSGLIAALALITVVAACGGTATPEPTGAAPDAGTRPPVASPTGQQGRVYLSPTAHLVRASMALRGVRPGLDELAAVAEHPQALPMIVDFYLAGQHFGQTVREMHEEALLLGVDPIIYPAGFVPPVAAAPGVDSEMQAFNQSLIEAPLRLIEHVVMTGRPYTEIVTADYGMADANVALVWGMDYRADGDGGWQMSHYNDARPMAGILSDSFLFTRHSSTLSSKGRGRANLVAQALLCQDFLSRELPLDSAVDLSDQSTVRSAVVENSACASCHQTLDPLAAFFSNYYPLFVAGNVDTFPFEFYRPAYGPALRSTEPSYFGITGGDITDLGAMIAQDPRFSACAARRFFGYLAQVEPEEVPLTLVDRLQGVLIDSGMDARALARAVVLSDEFRVSHGESASGEATEVHGLHKARPAALARMFEDLTGYRWVTHLPFDVSGGTVGTVDLMTDAFFGFDVLAGGTDGNNVTRPSHTMSATSTLTLEQLAAHASRHVVSMDFRLPRRTRYLLDRIDEGELDPASVRAQLQALVLRLFGQTVAPDESQIDELLALFAEGAAGSDTARGWQLVLYAMFQDVRMIYY